MVTKAKVSRRVPSGRFHESHIPAKAKGPGSTVVMAKTRLMGLAAAGTANRRVYIDWFYGARRRT